MARMKYGLASGATEGAKKTAKERKNKMGQAPIKELQKFGYDPKSAGKAGLRGAAKGLVTGAQIGSAGGIPGMAAGAAIGAGLGFVGGFSYDMISGGDNLSQALSSYKLQKDSEKLAAQTLKQEQRAQKRTKEAKKREPGLTPIADTERDIMNMAFGAGTSQFDQFMGSRYGVG